MASVEVESPLAKVIVLATKTVGLQVISEVEVVNQCMVVTCMAEEWEEALEIMGSRKSLLDNNSMVEGILEDLVGINLASPNKINSIPSSKLVEKECSVTMDQWEVA